MIGRATWQSRRDGGVAGSMTTSVADTVICPASVRAVASTGGARKSDRSFGVVPDRPPAFDPGPDSRGHAVSASF